MPKNFLTAEWTNLIMANYIVDKDLLLPWLPYKTALDEFKGNTYISLVGFKFADTRVLGLNIPFHTNFTEVNLRFYVRYNDKSSWKRGVVFIKEIVPKHAITLVANKLYKEKYCTMPMKHSHEHCEEVLKFSYQWKYKRQWNKLEATTEKISVPMDSESEEEFIAEHYWGYSKYNSQTTFEYEVQHPAWEIYPVKEYAVDCRFEAIYGSEFGFLETAKPASVFVAKGSLIKVLNKTRL